MRPRHCKVVAYSERLVDKAHPPCDVPVPNHCLSSLRPTRLVRRVRAFASHVASHELERRPAKRFSGSFRRRGLEQHPLPAVDGAIPAELLSPPAGGSAELGSTTVLVDERHHGLAEHLGKS